MARLRACCRVKVARPPLVAGKSTSWESGAKNPGVPGTGSQGRIRGALAPLFPYSSLLRRALNGVEKDSKKPGKANKEGH